MGGEGWDAGSWPYIIFAVARTRDGNGELFGYGTYVEGDASTHWFRSQDACFEAITAEVFFHWNSGQSDGPDSLPATAPNCRTRTAGRIRAITQTRGANSTPTLPARSSWGRSPRMHEGFKKTGTGNVEIGPLALDEFPAQKRPFPLQTARGVQKICELQR